MYHCAILHDYGFFESSILRVDSYKFVAFFFSLYISSIHEYFDEIVVLK